MLRSYNKPYVKRYDENGKITNPIKGAYLTNGLNRRQRREPVRTKRKINCKKSGPWQRIDMFFELIGFDAIKLRTKFINHTRRYS